MGSSNDHYFDDDDDDNDADIDNERGAGKGGEENTVINMALAISSL